MPGLKEQYNKQRRRLQQFIRRAKKRGYIFPDDIIPPRPKKITQGSINRLAKITPKSLYENAQYVKQITLPSARKMPMETVSGLRGRQLEREQSAKKASQTRREKQWQQWARNYEAGKESQVEAIKVTKPSEELATISDEDYDTIIEEHKDIIDQEANRRAKEIVEQERKKREADRLGQIRRDFYSEREETGDEADLNEALAIIQNIRNQIAEWEPRPIWSQNLARTKEKDKNILSSLFESAIKAEGENAVALRLLNHAEEINDIVQQVLYGSGGSKSDYDNGRAQVNFDLARFSEIVKGGSLTYEEAIDIADRMETNELF